MSEGGTRNDLPGKIREFQKRVIDWYINYGDSHIPWRNTNNPWFVLVAAILLRKTAVAQVLKIYPVFIEKYPDPFAMARSSKEEIRELIRPLGMEHQRAELFIKLAKALIERFQGRVPCSFEELKELPGVGDYAASEVLLVACERPAPLLDRNMIRIIERVFGIRSVKRRKHTDPEMWAFAKRLVPKEPKKAKLFNYGVLDFARKICIARNPRCGKCPIKDICCYYTANRK